jgi:anti-sigma28 factor (negative regulator of flagellin synthesis)
MTDMKAAKPVRTASKPAPSTPRLQGKIDRIERIRLAIAEGTYQVDALAVSKAIIRKSIVR